MELCPRIERVADRLFEGEEAVLHVIERIVAPLGLRVDATSPWVDARLPDGLRVQTRFLSAPLKEFSVVRSRRPPAATEPLRSQRQSARTAPTRSTGRPSARIRSMDSSSPTLGYGG